MTFRDPTQKRLPFGRAMLLLAVGCGMIYFGFEVVTWKHALWMVPVGAIMAFYAVGRLVSR